MIRHQDNKIIFNEQVSFELPEWMHLDPHPETHPSDNELHLVAPDKGYKLVIALLTVDKTAKEFTEEIYEEYDSVQVLEQLYGMESASGIKGWATRFTCNGDLVEEVTLDLPGDPHTLFNMHYWKPLQSTDDGPFDRAIHEILKSVRMLQDNLSQPSENLKQPTTNVNKRRRGRQPDPIAYSKTYYYPNAIVTVRFPDISDEENERRMKRVKETAAEVIKEKIRIDRERERKEREAQEKQQE